MKYNFVRSTDILDDIAVEQRTIFSRNHLQLVSEASAKSSTDEDLLEKKHMG